MNSELETYRRDNGRTAAVIAGAVVLFLTAVAGYLVAQAIRIGEAGPIAAATTHAVQQSVGRIVDERLTADRVRMLLGLAEQPAAPNTPTAGLQKVMDAQVGMTKAGASAYFTTAVAELSKDLKGRLAAEISVARLNEIRRHARSESLQLQCQRIERYVTDALATAATAVVDEWSKAAAADPALAQAWGAARSPGLPVHATLHTFLAQAVAPADLIQRLARRVATDLTVSAETAGERQRAIGDLSARFAWGTTAIIFVGICGAAILVPLWQIWTLLPARRVYPTLVIAVLVAVVIGVTVAQLPAVSPDRIEFFGPILIGHEAELGTWVIGLSRALTGLAAAAVVVMFAGAWASVWVDDSVLVETQLESLRLIFNTGAAALVAGTLQLAVLYGWAAAIVGVTGDNSSIGKAALAAAGYPGAIFSIALLAIYVPPLAVLKIRARTADAARQTQLANQGLSDSAREKFLVLLQALAPLLAAIPMSGLISILGG
jgi:hypothetical protein